MSLPSPGNPPTSSPASARAGQTAPFEIEIKLPVADLAAALDRIRGIGFLESEPRAFESNVVYDDAGRSLFASKRLLRVREYGGAAVITFKGTPVPGKHKQREEIETTLGSAAAFDAILTRLGYVPTFRYEKFRTVFVREGTQCIVTVDETPIGPYLELEGEPEAIDRVAAELSYAQADYITASYAAVWMEYASAKGLPFGDFVFPKAGATAREADETH